MYVQFILQIHRQIGEFLQKVPQQNHLQLMCIEQAKIHFQSLLRVYSRDKANRAFQFESYIWREFYKENDGLDLRSFYENLYYF